MDRKEFIRTSGRWVILSLIAAISTGLLVRRRYSEENTCNISDPCSQCGSLASCNLPRALKYRKDEQEKGL